MDPNGDEITRLNKSHLVNIIKSLDHTGTNLKKLLMGISDMRSSTNETDKQFLDRVVVKLGEAKAMLDFLPKTMEDIKTAPNSNKKTTKYGTISRGSNEDEDKMEGDEDNEPKQVSRPRHSKLDSNTPIFGEKRNDSVDDWIFSVNNSMKVANIPEELKLSVVTPYLRGLPLLALKRYQKDYGDDAYWDEFCDILTAQCKPVGWQDKLRIQQRKEMLQMLKSRPLCK
jgi:hypothetical protein